MNQLIQLCPFMLLDEGDNIGIPHRPEFRNTSIFNVLFASFHNGNLDERVLAAQKSVFDHFGIHLNQWHSHRPHGEAMDELMEAARSFPWDVACLFDADAIPTGRWPFFVSISRVLSGAVDIYGGAHNANHHRLISGELCPDYISPACQIVSRSAHDRLCKSGYGNYAIRAAGPDETGFYDAGEFRSRMAYGLGLKIQMDYPKAVADPRWSLAGDRALMGNTVRFGIGTEYQKFYHQFEIRTGNNVEAFVQRCERAIRENA